MKENVMG